MIPSKVSPKTSPTPKSIDVAQFLRMLHRPDSIFEIRALKVQARRESDFTSTHSGYYTYDRIDEAAQEIAQLDATGLAPAIYVTINPANPALLARADHRLKSKAQSTTTDGEIAKRTAFLVDIDPVRPAGISSTLGEMQAALGLATKIRRVLRVEGWPAPLLGMSGNGAYLLFAIDLSNDADTDRLIKAVLKGLAQRFDTDQVKLDLAVSNASRIMKVLGTTARKGDATKDRPHRRSWFCPPTAPLESVTRGQLEVVAHQAKPTLAPRIRATASDPSRAASTKERCRKYVEQMRDSVQGEQGSDRMFAAACVCIKFDLSVPEAMEVLEEFNANKCDPPWSSKEIQHKLDDATRKVEGAGERGSFLRDSITTASVGTIMVGGSLNTQTQFPPTDAGNGERFAKMWGSKIKYWGGNFYIFDKNRWVRDDHHAVDQYAKKTARSIMKEAAQAQQLSVRNTLSKWAITSEGVARLEAMVSRAKSEPQIRIAATAFDADPYLFNVQNGTIDLRTGKIREHRRKDYITKISPVKYDPQARCKLWEASLRVWLPNEQDIRFAQVAVGYSLTGLVDEEIFFCLFGPEASGKTTFAEAVKMVAGDYATTADFETFLKKPHGTGGGARGDIVRLKGSRIVTSSEVDDGRELGAGLIKNITGKDTITARGLYKEEIEFMPTHKLWMIANHPPYIDPEDGAMWRRVVRLPFIHTIPPDKRNPRVKSRLLDPQESGSGILNWILAGAGTWHRDGKLVIPKSIQGSVEELRGSMDSSAEFFEDYLKFAPTFQAPVSAIRLAYDIWAEAAGVARTRRLGPKGMAKKLQARGCQSGRDPNGNRIWSGVLVHKGIASARSSHPT